MRSKTNQIKSTSTVSSAPTGESGCGGRFEMENCTIKIRNQTEKYDSTFNENLHFSFSKS